MQNPPPKFHKDQLLRQMLQVLATRGIARAWAEMPRPYSAISAECKQIASDQNAAQQLGEYLKANPIVQETVETLLAHLAMTANVRWQDTPAIVQPLSRRGWHISRWLPTFLIIDGPLGRVLTAASSPLFVLLRSNSNVYPAICQARDMFNNDLFRRVRNGVGHWSFLWTDTQGAQELVMVEEKTNARQTKISLLEAEALHLVAFSVIEALDRELFSVVNPRNAGA
jgi:hypothetical protein